MALVNPLLKLKPKVRDQLWELMEQMPAENRFQHIPLNSFVQKRVEYCLVNPLKVTKITQKNFSSRTRFIYLYTINLHPQQLEQLRLLSPDDLLSPGREESQYIKNYLSFFDALGAKAMEIKWSPFRTTHPEKDSGIPINEIIDVVQGRTTTTFQTHDINKSKLFKPTYESENSMSVLAGTRTLDIEFENHHDYEIFDTALRYLLGVL